jgi:hypothetical protein
MNIKKDFEKVFFNYNKIISLKELEDFSHQLSNIGYKIRIKKLSNYVYFNYEKPSFNDILKRIKYYLGNGIGNIINNRIRSKLNNQSKNRLILQNYQKIIYKM